MILLKGAFIVCLIGYLIQKGFISTRATLSALDRREIIIPVGIALLLSTFLGIFRWFLLLQAHQIRIPFQRVVQLGLIGTFFNVALPGAVSGDLVKTYYVGMEVPGKRTLAFGSIFFDRIAGLSALALVSAGGLFLNYDAYRGTPLLAALGWIIRAAALSVVLFYSYLFILKEKHDPILKGMQRLEKLQPKLHAFTRIYLSLRHYHRHKLTVLSVLALSIAIHLIMGWICYQLGLALGEAQISLPSLYVILGIGLLITAIPIAPGGIGTGNAAFFYLFHLLGSSRGGDVFSLLALLNFGVAALGGLVYLRFKTLRGLQNGHRS
jgi:uncharacterized protein (TIRG00374 family)